MSFFEFPHTRTYDSDLGWLIRAMHKVIEELENFVELNRIKYADPITWSIDRNYEATTIVLDSQGNGYISQKPVPAGVPLSDSEYWTQIFSFGVLLDELREQIAAVNEGDSTTASAARSVGDLVWLSGVLYKVIADMPIGTQYVEGSNIEHVTVEDLLHDVIDLIEDTRIGLLNDLGVRSVMEFGAVADGVTDDSQAFIDAMNSGYSIIVPVGDYALSQPIPVTGERKELYVEPGAILRYNGNDALLTLTGHDHNINLLGEFILTGGNAQYGIRYWSLRTSIINVAIMSSGSVAGIYHDASADTSVCGNNRWSIGRLECGNKPYGVKIDSSSYLYEGDYFNIKVIFSFSVAAFVLGSSDHNTVRYNMIDFAPDAQGSAGQLLIVNNSENNCYVRVWACGNPVKIVMNHEKNFVFVEHGTSATCEIALNGYKNFIFYPDSFAGIRDIEGQVKINPKEQGATAVPLQICNNEAITTGDNGADVLEIKNKSTANVITKSTTMNIGGYDTNGAAKIGCSLQAVPDDANWTASHLALVVNNKAYAGLLVYADHIVLPQSWTPGSPSLGRVGSISWDENNLYVKTGSSTWKKVALTAI